MNKLDIARDTINKIDKQMAELFCERMQAVKTVAEYKKQVGMPIFDAQREEAIIKNNSKFIMEKTGSISQNIFRIYGTVYVEKSTERKNPNAILVNVLF